MCNVDRMTVAKQPLPIRPPYDKLWLQVNKVIDKLHLKNYKNPRCKELYNPESVKEKCPKLNTPVAEQTFIWASRFKKILGAMPKSHFLFFYHRMVVRRNKYTEKCYKNNMQPLLPKLRSEKSINGHLSGSFNFSETPLNIFLPLPCQFKLTFRIGLAGLFCPRHSQLRFSCFVGSNLYATARKTVTIRDI